MTRYFAHISGAGAVRYGRVPGSIGVREAPDKPMPIGMACCIGWDPACLAADDRRRGPAGMVGDRRSGVPAGRGSTRGSQAAVVMLVAWVRFVLLLLGCSP